MSIVCSRGIQHALAFGAYLATSQHGRTSPHTRFMMIHDVFSNSFRRASPGSYRPTFLCGDTAVPSEQPFASIQGKRTILGPAGRSVANLHIVGRALGPGNDRTDSRVLLIRAACARSCFVSSIFSCKALDPEIKTFVVCTMEHLVIRAMFDSLFRCGKKPKLPACLCHTRNIYEDCIGSEGVWTRR